LALYQVWRNPFVFSGGNFRSKRVISGLVQEVNRELPVFADVTGYL